jgi:hypothetical protein
MSRYEIKPFENSNLKTYSIGVRKSKVGIMSFAKPYRCGESIHDFLQSFPDILAGKELRFLVRRIIAAKKEGKPIIWGIGGHVIKTGLAPILIDLMHKGFVTGIAMNGAGIIHDYEIAISGSTSEDVAEQLQNGEFGCAEETGREINSAITMGNELGLGIGESIGQYLHESDIDSSSTYCPFAESSLLLHAFRLNVPVSVHVTIGTDIVNIHNSIDPSALGTSSYRDFKLFATQISQMHDGGVYLNWGSAVTLPEVFLKALAMVRANGISVKNFYTANFDFIQHYRPTQNVVKRPVQNGGRGFAFTGHHELMLPLFAAMLISTCSDVDE